MEIISVGPDWAQKVVCGSCRSALKVIQADLGWYKKQIGTRATSASAADIAGQ